MTDEEAPPVIPMDKLVRVYRKMRDQMQQLTREYEREFAEIEAKQILVKNALKDQMLALGTTSITTGHGTVVLGKQTRYNTQDWDSFKEFVKEHDAVDLLEKRIAQTNMATFLEDNPGVVPPGL